MNELTLEALAKRVEALERLLLPKIDESAADNRWHSVVGLFTGSEFMKQVDAEALAIREQDRIAARTEFGE